MKHLQAVKTKLMKPTNQLRKVQIAVMEDYVKLFRGFVILQYCLQLKALKLSQLERICKAFVSTIQKACLVSADESFHSTLLMLMILRIMVG